MKMLDFDSLKLKLVEKKKIWFFVPLVALVIGIVFGTIFGFAFKGDVFNLGMDFTGGYSLNVVLGTSLDDPATYAEKSDILIDTIENKVVDPDTNAQITGLVVKSIAKQGEGSDTALYVKFIAPYNYGQMMGDQNKDGYIDIIGDTVLDALVDENDFYGGFVTNGDTVSATVSSELIMTAICGILMSVALMLIYIAVRFELLSGIIAIICLLHDIAMMFIFMTVFHIEITATFVAAIITILGYSINNTIIIFDKIRDNVRNLTGAPVNEIANNAVSTTLMRSFNTTLTTFITVLMVCIVSIFFGVGDLIVFCLPLMAGLLAGTFSSVFLAPSLWSWWKGRKSSAPEVETLPPKGFSSMAYEVPDINSNVVSSETNEIPDKD